MQAIIRFFRRWRLAGGSCQCNWQSSSGQFPVPIDATVTLKTSGGTPLKGNPQEND
jgi:hypothetical protein